MIKETADRVRCKICGHGFNEHSHDSIMYHIKTRHPEEFITANKSKKGVESDDKE